VTAARSVPRDCETRSVPRKVVAAARSGGWIERAATSEDGLRIPLPRGSPKREVLGPLSTRPRSAPTKTLRWPPDTHAYQPINAISSSIPRPGLICSRGRAGMSVGQGKGIDRARKLEQTQHLPTARYHEEVASMLRAQLLGTEHRPQTG
jgi:hypothetical protein